MLPEPEWRRLPGVTVSISRRHCSPWVWRLIDTRWGSFCWWGETRDRVYLSGAVTCVCVCSSHARDVSKFCGPDCYCAHMENIFFLMNHLFLNFALRHSAVCIATGYGLDHRGVGVRGPVEWKIVSVSPRTCSGAHTASYPMGMAGSFPGCKAAEAWSWPLTSN
jgi:hypothetical protein